MTAVFLTLVLLFAVGVIVNQLFRMRDWLAKAPPPEPADGGDDDDAGSHE